MRANVRAIRTLRRNAGLRLVDVARACGVSHPTVSHWESGITMPTADKLPVLAATLHCSIDDLFRADAPDAPRRVV